MEKLFNETQKNIIFKNKSASSHSLKLATVAFRYHQLHHHYLHSTILNFTDFKEFNTMSPYQSENFSILFSAADLTDLRKGGDLMVDILEQLDPKLSSSLTVNVLEGHISKKSL